MAKCEAYAEAVRLGNHRYFTGKPCHRGHISERWTGRRKCIECCKEKFAQKKEVIASYQAEWYRANRETARASGKRWYGQNKGSVCARTREWAKANPDKVRTSRQKYYRENIPKFRAKHGRYMAHKGKACPRWADRKGITAVYAEARRLQAETGIPRHVDHIIPLRGKNVCGLHVHTNLQILTAQENVRKRNAFGAG